MLLLVVKYQIHQFGVSLAGLSIFSDYILSQLSSLLFISYFKTTSNKADFISFSVIFLSKTPFNQNSKTWFP